MNSSCTASYKNEPEFPPEPLSIMFIPANLDDGVFVFNVTYAAPITKFEELIFWIDEEPATTKSCEIYNEPVIVWVPVNTFALFVLAKVPLTASFAATLCVKFDAEVINELVTTPTSVNLVWTDAV